MLWYFITQLKRLQKHGNWFIDDEWGHQSPTRVRTGESGQFRRDPSPNEHPDQREQRTEGWDFIITVHKHAPSYTTTPCPYVYPTEALKLTNLSMKERFEGLSAWKETQKEERNFLEKRLEEAKTRLNTMDSENEALKKRVEELEKSGAEVRQDRNCEKSYHSKNI